MCLSAEVDLAAGLVTSAIGFDAIRHIKRKTEAPLAYLPLMLGMHQFVEVVVWLSLNGTVGEPVGRAAAYVYLLVAFAVLPIYVPLAIRAVEPHPRRQRSILFAATGLVVTATLTHDLFSGPMTARIVGHHIDYRIDVWNLYLIIGLYLVATCGPLVTSRLTPARWFGTINLAAAGLLGWIDQTAFISLWCLWAAIASAAIAAHLRHPTRIPPLADTEPGILQ